MKRPVLKVEDHPFFSDLDAEYIDRLNDLAEETEFEPRDIIFREGTTEQTVYLVFEGKVAIETKSNHKGLIKIHIIDAGEVLGWSWFFPPYECHFDARSLEFTKALALDCLGLRALSDKDHDFGYYLLRKIASITVQRLTWTRSQLAEYYR
ncbi:Crp/Fnr family transcriptional regulator [candidate division KSB1 bacterium]